VAEEEEPAEHRQPTGAGDDQRLEGCVARLLLVAAIADEQERRDRGELPEPVQHEEVVGEDEAHHGSAEQREEAEEAPDPWVSGVEVGGGVDEDGQSDPRSEQDHDRRQ
jgi:hypothetical protein